MELGLEEAARKKKQPSKSKLFRRVQPRKFGRKKSLHQEEEEKSDEKDNDPSDPCLFFNEFFLQSTGDKRWIQHSVCKG